MSESNYSEWWDECIDAGMSAYEIYELEDSECAPDSSATSLLPRRRDATSPAAGRPRYPDTRCRSCGIGLVFHETRGSRLCKWCRSGKKAPVSERSERSG